MTCFERTIKTRGREETLYRWILQRSVDSWSYFIFFKRLSHAHSDMPSISRVYLCNFPP